MAKDDRAVPEEKNSGSQHYEALFLLSQDMLCVAGFDARFKRVNPAFERTLGFTAAELLAGSFMDFVHPDDVDATLREVDKLAAGVPSINFENRYRCCDGSYKSLSWKASPDNASGCIYAVARDVTANRHRENRLKEREKQLLEAQDTAAVGSWEWNLESNVMTWSDELYRLLGSSENEFVPSYERYLSVVHPDDREQTDRAIRSGIARNQPYSIEHRIVRADGQVRHILGRGRTILDDAGRPVRTLGTAQDITEQRLADETSRLLARVTHGISTASDFQSALVLTLRELCEAEGWDYGEVWLARADGSLECSAGSYTRSESLRAFRRRSEEFVCKGDLTLPGRVYATKRAEWHANIQEAADDVFCRVAAACKAGLKACVGVPLMADGEVLAVLVLLRSEALQKDERQLTLLETVTAQLGVAMRRREAEQALRRSEERFQIAAKATSDVIYDWDLTSDALWLSEGIARNFGFVTHPGTIEWWASLIHPDDASELGSSLTAALEGPELFWSGEYRFRCADESYTYVFDRGFIVRDANGSPVRMIGSMMDISARTRAAQELKHAKDAAEAAAIAKSQFIANMSHEIRTPLTAVLGFADLLLDPRLTDSERLNYAMTIRRNGEHLLSVLNDILDLSKIEAGRLTTEHIECSPAQIVTDVASLMRVRATEKGLAFNVRYKGPIPALVRTDPTRLRQIVLNLVNNAIKFTDRGSVALIAGCEDISTRSPRLTIAVTDTGIGMNSEHLSRLFQPFSQADASTTRRYGGTGLGLGICAPLAAALGGEIAVVSELGRGSTFTLTLPLEALDAVEMISEPSEAFAAGPTGTMLQSEEPPAELGGRVLLAEDGPDNQVLIASLLRKRGVDVTVVENGRLALEHVLAEQRAGNPYDLVLMDMQMPELDGYGATAQLRQKGYKGAIVALTAHAMAGERGRCLAAGCDDYLTKPIERSILLSTTRDYLSRARKAPAGTRSPSAAKRPSLPWPPEQEPLLSSFADDPDMTEIVAAFVNGLEAQMTALSQAAQREDRETIQRLAHQLRGAAGGYGFGAITEAAAVVEDCVRNGADAVDTGRALSSLNTLCSRARFKPAVPTANVAQAPSILAIDDSVQIHELIEARLRSEGLVVHRALDAVEGLAMARTHRPDLILLDLDLPGTSGLDVCRRLQMDPETSSLPVLFLTSTTDAAVKAQALDLGAVDYVTKPFDAVELRARVRVALRSKRYQDMLATRAQLDGLSGLWNREYFNTRLPEEIGAATRHKRPLSLIMLDVDHFKVANDSYGHPFGDLVLQRVAAALTQSTRSSDVVCRFGGEEFAIILRETSGAAGAVAAEKLRAVLADLTFVAKGKRVSITASFGVAALEFGSEQKLRTSAGLVAAADAALYRSKHAGRNCVHLAGPATDSLATSP